jgi:hypothetical protein
LLRRSNFLADRPLFFGAIPLFALFELEHWHETKVFAASGAVK